MAFPGLGIAHPLRVCFNGLSDESGGVRAVRETVKGILVRASVTAIVTFAIYGLMVFYRYRFPIYLYS